MSASWTGPKAKIVYGIDDHSRFVIPARVVARATARPVWEALMLARRSHGVPEEILTDIHTQSRLDRAVVVQLAA